MSYYSFDRYFLGSPQPECICTFWSRKYSAWKKCGKMDSKMIMIIRQVWVLNWFLCYWFKSKKKWLAWIASASEKCSQCTVFVFVKFCLVMHSVNVFLENWYFGHYLPTNIIISSRIFNISILYTYIFIYMILAIKSVYISNI